MNFIETVPDVKVSNYIRVSLKAASIDTFKCVAGAARLRAARRAASGPNSGSHQCPRQLREENHDACADQRIHSPVGAGKHVHGT